MPNLNKLVCKRCIMDSINDPDILINDDGVCNHCITFDFEFNKLPKGINKEKELESIIKKIKLTITSQANGPKKSLSSFFSECFCEVKESIKTGQRSKITLAV